MKNIFILALVLGMFLAPARKAEAAEMTISAAASLANAFNEICGIFEKENPGLKIYTNYAASTPLLKQMEEGAPVDVFASADQVTMDQAQDAKLIDPATRITFAINDLVVIVPKGEPAPKSLADLQKYSRMAIGDPDSVPGGRYAKAFLQKDNLWNSLEKKFILAADVRQALQYVASAEVEAGFVYATDAAQMPDKVDVAFAVPLEKPVSYPIAVAITGSNPAAGAKFVRFIMTEPAQGALNRHGFISPVAIGAP